MADSWVRSAGIFAAAACIAALAGCAVGPNFKPPRAPNVKRYTQRPLPKHTAYTPGVAEGTKQKFVVGADLPGQWWSLFHSAALDSLVKKAIHANPTLQAARASLRVAREDYLATEGGLFPSLSADIQVTRQKTSGSLFGQPTTTGDIYTLYNAKANVSYTLDLFGGVRRAIERSEAATTYSRFELEGAYLALTSNVATAAIHAASLRTQILITHRIIAAQRGIVDIVRRQLRLGGASQTELQQQLAVLARDQTLLPPLRKNLAQTMHQLAALTGRFPGQMQSLDLKLEKIKLPHELPISLPSKLIEQRPDVRIAQALLHEASANVGIATANMLPDVTLTADIGSAVTHPGDLFSPGGGIWSLSGGLLQPIFEGGALLHKKRAAVAAYDQAAADYRKTVLAAFENVADALRDLTDDAAALKTQKAAEQAAKYSYKLAREQYQAGGIGYPALLQAILGYRQSLVALSKARAARLSDTVALFQALGGGWWNRNDLAGKGGTNGLTAARSD